MTTALQEDDNIKGCECGWNAAGLGQGTMYGSCN
jgi:hypothetical protein